MLLKDGSLHPLRLGISVTEWSTPADEAALARAITAGGQDGLIAELETRDRGFIRHSLNFGWRINHAMSFDTAEGRRVRLFCERPINLSEDLRGTRAPYYYGVGVIELTIDEKGNGTGRILGTAKVGVNAAGELEVESIGLGPHPIIELDRED